MTTASDTENTCWEIIKVWESRGFTAYQAIHKVMERWKYGGENTVESLTKE